MTRRFTETEKWRDMWFRRLKPNAKLLFIYICENCDCAGFWEIDLELAAQETGIYKSRIKKHFEEISKSYQKKGRYIWLVNFLKYQCNLPLSKNKPAHIGIARLIGSKPTFLDAIAILKDGIGMPTSISISKSKSISTSKGGVVGGGEKSKTLPYYRQNMWDRVLSITCCLQRQ